jgi:ACS family D-galactonate transporter-like MFS transporter
LSFVATGVISLLYFALFYLFYQNPSEDKFLRPAEREFITKGGAQPEGQARAANGAPLKPRKKKYQRKQDLAHIKA